MRSCRDPPRWGPRIRGSAVIASSVLLALFLVASPARGDVFVERGVVFAPSGSHAEMSFAQNHTFGEVSVDATAAIFDGVRFEMGKTPSTGNVGTIVVQTWNPNGTEGVILNWTATVAASSIVYVNVSGLRNITYTLYVDDVSVAQVAGPNVATNRSMTSSHVFRLDAGAPPQLPEAPPWFNLGGISPFILIAVIGTGIVALIAVLYGRKSP